MMNDKKIWNTVLDMVIIAGIACFFGWILVGSSQPAYAHDLDYGEVSPVDQYYCKHGDIIVDLKLFLIDDFQEKLAEGWLPHGYVINVGVNHYKIPMVLCKKGER